MGTVDQPRLVDQVVRSESAIVSSQTACTSSDPSQACMIKEKKDGHSILDTK
jgi:hypothetical protein